MRRKPLPPTCIVWGRGAAASQIVREGEATERAAIVARAYGWESDDPEAWAVEVQATTADVDAATRADGAVWGWLPLVERPESYPWRRCLYPEGWEVETVTASCSADDHYSHPYCAPGWEEDVAAGGGLVLQDALLDSWSGWIALVAWPPAPAAVEEVRP